MEFLIKLNCASAIFVLLLAQTFAVGPDDLFYGYKCTNGRCAKVELNERNFATAISLPVCRMFCGDISTLWPKPSGFVKIDPYMAHIDTKTIQYQMPGGPQQAKYWDVNKKRFEQIINAKILNPKVLKSGGWSLKIVLETLDYEMPRLTLETDESYTLKVEELDGVIKATIKAKLFFGARHGLETLSQLIIYDDLRREIQIVKRAEIEDKPTYKWRGLLLDTSRNFFPTNAIKRTINTMAMVKLNTFHWHITDSHSFPIEISRQPELAKLGAYSPRKVYTHDDIRDIVDYGLARGVRVMPEFDAPAHVGEGWQRKNMTVCFKAQPWTKYCVEPPCGQLDPTEDGLYDVLEDIYDDMFTLFSPDVFHMGGDEVSIDCWNSSEKIRNWMVEQGWGLEEKDFMRLWGAFQTQALDRVDKVSSGPPIILWTSRLTHQDYIDEYINKKRYIIQIWSKGAATTEILKLGYKIILSNSDGLYFDCGGPNWVSNGSNWCSPYIGWQKVYENRISDIAKGYTHLVLGAEAVVWSEQIDEFTLDSRFWPRASAMAERLWSDPTEGWREAEARMLVHRENLVENGIGAESLQPQWCLQNQNECPIDAYVET